MGKAYPIEYTELLQMLNMRKHERMMAINKILSRPSLGEFDVFKNRFEVTP